MIRLIKMVLLAFFSMLIFSNLIIMLTTTYISREVEFAPTFQLWRLGFLGCQIGYRHKGGRERRSSSRR